MNIATPAEFVPAHISKASLKWLRSYFHCKITSVLESHSKCQIRQITSQCISLQHKVLWKHLPNIFETFAEGKGWFQEWLTKQKCSKLSKQTTSPNKLGWIQTILPSFSLTSSMIESCPIDFTPKSIAQGMSL